MYITNDIIQVLRSTLNFNIIIILYRRRFEFGMLDTDGLNTDVSEEELHSRILEFKQDDPNVGVSMAVGLLRARGYKITRA